MRFLADESCDFAVVRALRAAGHDVRAVAEPIPGGDDEDVIELATRDNRLLLTEDKDFGQLVFAHIHTTGGVILIRFPGGVRAALPKAVIDLVNEMGERLMGCFVVIQPGRIRMSHMPEA